MSFKTGSEIDNRDNSLESWKNLNPQEMHGWAFPGGTETGGKMCEFYQAEPGVFRA